MRPKRTDGASGGDSRCTVNRALIQCQHTGTGQRHRIHDRAALNSQRTGIRIDGTTGQRHRTGHGKTRRSRHTRGDAKHRSRSTGEGAAYGATSDHHRRAGGSQCSSGLSCHRDGSTGDRESISTRH